MSNDYSLPMANGQDHPLKDVDPAVLACARRTMAGVAMTGDLHPDLVEPVADAIVCELHLEGFL